MNTLIVSKFGGTSVANSKNINLVKNILKQNSDRKIVVVSAPGKRNSNDIKITDSLLQIFSLNENQQNYDEIFDKIKQRYIDLANELKVDFDVETAFKQFKKEIDSGTTVDYIASRGEFFSAKIIAKFLGFKFIDAKNIIVFDAKNKVNMSETQKAWDKFYKAGDKIVVPGFYGALAQKNAAPKNARAATSGTNNDINSDIKESDILTFSRGGSDVTGAILATVANAKTYENWTDVSGFLAADPRIVKNPRQILCLTYRDLRELSYMGASVLHTDCAFFVSKKNIPINIKNTFEPENPGTLILSERDVNAQNNEKTLTGITGQKNFSLIYIEKYNLNNMIGVFEMVAHIFKKNAVSIEHMPTNIDGLSIVFKCSNQEIIKNIILSIKKALKPDKITLSSNIALICLVLGSVQATDGLKTIFQTLHQNNIKTILTTKDSSSLSVTVGVHEADYENAIVKLYEAF